MMKIMTKREFYEKVIESVDNAEIIDYAKAEIEKLDSVNAKRKTKKDEEKASIDEKVVAFVTADMQTATAIKEALNATIENKDDHYSISKVVASLKRLSEKGVITISEARKGSRIVNSYALAQ